MSKFRLTFKTPDVTAKLEEEQLDILKKWLKYGENITTINRIAMQDGRDTLITTRSKTPNATVLSLNGFLPESNRLTTCWESNRLVRRKNTEQIRRVWTRKQELVKKFYQS